MKSTFSIIFYLKRQVVKKDGTVPIMETDTDWNHKPISIDFYGYFAPRKSCDKEYSNNHKNMIR